MQPRNRLQRAYQPTESEVNADFLREYVRRSTLAGNGDERVADPDSTFGRLLNWVFNRHVPKVATTNATIRVGLPVLGAPIDLSIRHFFQITILLGFCYLLRGANPTIAFHVIAWCTAANFAMAVVGHFSRNDTTLFFRQLSEFLKAFAIVLLIVLLWHHSAPTKIIWALAGILLAIVVSFPYHPISAGGDRRCARLICTMLLLFAVPDLSFVSTGGLLLVGCLWCANFFLLLPVPFALQHWFVAHRYATLDDLRNYGPGVGIHRGNCRAVLSGVTALVLAALTAWACSKSITNSIAIQVCTPDASQLQLWSILRAIGLVQAIAFANWCAFDVAVHQRLSRPIRFFSSYYATWRAIAVWASPQFPLMLVTVFQFQRPWSTTAVRKGLVVCAMAVNSMLVIYAIGDWTAPYREAIAAVEQREMEARNLPTPLLDQHSLKYSNEEQKPPSTTLWNPLTSTRYWLAVVGLTAFLPPTICFLVIHAAWGPTFQAFADRFECFEDDIIPPVLNFSLRTSRK